MAKSDVGGGRHSRDGRAKRPDLLRMRAVVGFIRSGSAWRYRRRSCRGGANPPDCEAYGSCTTSQTSGFGVSRKPRSIFSLSAFAK